jgi:hypothetical protein
MWQAKIIAHSICAHTQKEIITWELVYPRFIHSELMTHRLFSRNAASSRAIPIAKVIEMVDQNPASPIHWGKNQPGMQAENEFTGEELDIARDLWSMAAGDAVATALKMAEFGLHKQVVNRILEPFQWMKTIVTYTEGTNWFWLRDHKAADPNIKKLAGDMYNAYEESFPVLLLPGDWHVPYFGATGQWYEGKKNGGYSLQGALNISMSCCAQVSYRTLDDTLEKAERVVERLNLGVDLEEPCHASPSEHQATPMQKEAFYGSIGESVRVNNPSYPNSWEDGITAYHKELGFMSGNFAGWIQNRQLIKGHTRW